MNSISKVVAFLFFFCNRPKPELGIFEKVKWLKISNKII